MTMRADGIILYRTKRRDGITTDHVARRLNRTKRTDGIRHNPQDRRYQAGTTRQTGACKIS
jgi:hypothetical protein